MHLSPDQIVFWQYGVFKLNATIAFTWALMLVLAGGSRLITRKLSIGLERSRWQNLLEILVTGIEKQIKEVGLRNALPVCRHSQPLHRDSRLRAADCFALNHGRTRAVRICGRAVLWHRGAGGAQLPQVLYEADVHHAAI